MIAHLSIGKLSLAGASPGILTGVYLLIVSLGGILTSIVTPAGAGVIAVTYGLIIGCFVSRGFKLKDLPRIFGHRKGSEDTKRSKDRGRPFLAVP